MVQLTIAKRWLDNGLAPNRRRAIIWTNAFTDAYMRHWALCVCVWGGGGGGGGGVNKCDVTWRDVGEGGGGDLVWENAEVLS